MDKKFQTKRQRRDESSGDEEEEEEEESPKKRITPNKIVGDVKQFLKPKEYQWIQW